MNPKNFNPIAHIRAVMAERGMTIAKLAEAAKFEKADLSRVLAGKIDPRLSTVLRLLKALEGACCATATPAPSKAEPCPCVHGSVA